jgi:2-polyprenyl-3-methyl-5-hydroxy-6-metoxy-1,4-benzoquinol methylase
MKVAYVGSCFSEQFVSHVFGDSELVARYFRINTISLMDNVVVNLPPIDNLSEAFRRHITYENRKDFMQKIIETNPDVLVVDFIRDVRCPICKFNEGYLSFTYELLEESDVNRAAFLNGVNVIDFGSQAYVERLLTKLDDFCGFINRTIPRAAVLLIDFFPTSRYYGSKWTAEQFRNDYIFWSLRSPIIHDLVRLSGNKINNSKILRYNGPIFCSDNSRYGPSSVHYAPEVWKEMAVSFDRVSLSFPDCPSSDTRELESAAKESLLWLSDLCNESVASSEGLVGNGADISGRMASVEANHGDSMSVSEDGVRWAYRLLLGREPENASVVENHLKHTSRLSLVKSFLGCDEFRRHNPAVLPLPIGRFFDEEDCNIETEANFEQLDAMLSRIRTAWQFFGETEPYYSVITNDAYLTKNLQKNRDEFYAGGELGVRRTLAFLSRNGIDLSTIRHVLDYGCGVGRLTVSLAKQFPMVLGVDISGQHLDHAQRYAADHGIRNVSFMRVADLALLDSMKGIDLIFSVIVLQHNPPPIIAVILRKLLGALNPRGCMFFQVPTFIQGYSFTSADYLSKPSMQMEMHAIPQRVVSDIARECGCEVLEVREDSATGSMEMISHSFLVQKRV